jgi:hypothetical protein
MENTENNHLNYIKLSEVLTRNEMYRRIEKDDPEKLEFIRTYLKKRFNIDLDKDDMIVFEPLHASLIILLLYDIIEEYVSSLKVV